MGYGIDMTNKDGTPCMVEPHTMGGNIRLYEGKVPELTEAEISITYNYSKYYYDTIDKEDGLRWIYGKTGKQVAKRLGGAVQTLGTEFSGDYWEATEGNAGRVLNTLYKWAVQHPGGVFYGD